MPSHLRNHTLGWIGLGRMGYALAERLSRAGADLHGYNRTREKAEGLQACGVTLVERPADLSDRDIVFTMVSTADDLMAVTVGPEGLFSGERAPKVLIDLSTISPTASSEMRNIAKSHGCEMLVVPVSGNDVVARAGKLSIIASGPRPVFDQVDRYLGCLGKDVTYVGEGDISRIIKICHNLYLGICYSGLAEVAVLAEKQGVPRHVFMDVINKSVLGSAFSKYKTPVIANLDYTVTFTTALMLKDLKLGLQAAQESQTWLPTTQVVYDIVQSCVADGRSEEDYTIILDKLAQRSGLQLASEHADVTDGLS
jgi:3-hydroxyisobutyrate dehydrogenase